MCIFDRSEHCHCKRWNAPLLLAAGQHVGQVHSRRKSKRQIQMVGGRVSCRHEVQPPLQVLRWRAWSLRDVCKWPGEQCHRRTAAKEPCGPQQLPVLLAIKPYSTAMVELALVHVVSVIVIAVMLTAFLLVLQPTGTAPAQVLLNPLKGDPPAVTKTRYVDKRISLWVCKSKSLHPTWPSFFATSNTCDNVVTVSAHPWGAAPLLIAGCRHKFIMSVALTASSMIPQHAVHPIQACTSSLWWLERPLG